jgi:serine protease Do
VTVQPITPDLARSFGLDGERGALIADVVKDGPAAKAGLKSGDIVLEFDGKKIRDMNELPRIVAATPVGKSVSLKMLRDGKVQDVEVSVGRLADTGDEADKKNGEDKLGIAVRELTRDLANRMGLKETQGVVVTGVKSGSLAEEAGILPGDIVREVSGRSINTLADYEAAIRAVKKGDVVRFLLRRGGGNHFLAIRVE